MAQFARVLWPAVASVGLTMALSLTLRDLSPAFQVDPGRVRDGGVPMSEDAMRGWVDDWFSKHPIMGRSSSTAAVVADTFLVGPAASFRFDTDGNLSTVVDTAKIQVGQAILWRWISGSHTVTNGTGSSDPQVGSLFDTPSTSLAPQFQFTFNSPGTVPFFCRPHELSDMKGVVVVSGTATVGTPGGGRIGFTAGPLPNPSRSAVSFGFAVAKPGRVRAEVFDVRGRRIAVILDRSFDAGSYPATWDGRTRDGAAAAAGVYYLRLNVPGRIQTRPVTIAR